MAVLQHGIWHPNIDAEQLPYEDTFNSNLTLEKNRYHLYMSLACPFAHRPLLVIKYLGLEDVISISSVAAKRDQNGWLFDTVNTDPITHSQNLIELHLKTKPDYSGRVTVPILWDKKENRIVDNNSSNIALNLAQHWFSLAKNKHHLVPIGLSEKIIQLNTWIHNNVNRKVYHVGFATNQHDYDKESNELFNALDRLDLKLGQSKYLHGDVITLSDFFLLPSLVRFEAVYEVHFKANKKQLKEYQNLYRYLRDLVQKKCIRETIDINHMKLHYYYSHKHINPFSIIPAGPSVTW
ncbi:Predicted glutathione S-transferase [Marinomonas sp. MED121]|uniref:glutathione S-transferase C-terminal domain-containing protein n=1 Tax=Marinomonas sp. MED121 TaxID=314277 RepID=UPI000068FA30|nr:glutathione S-transferase C-terminal domain-containing protein [Marinomonas sp. MED121]EAQ64108.1 Predicted glutathione S-transferase [Marinomonas sp. MED121]